MTVLNKLNQAMALIITYELCVDWYSKIITLPSGLSIEWSGDFDVFFETLQNVIENYDFEAEDREINE